MNLLLHAITPLDAAADTPLAGLREQPLVRVDEQGLAAWATEFREAPDQLTRTDLLSYLRRHMPKSPVEREFS